MNRSTMRNVVVNKNELIESLKENLKNHRKIFLEAQENYKKRVMEELESMLHDARNGRQVKKYISLPEPEDHSHDYESSIRMLEMCVDNEIEITSNDFNCYVMDEWGWKDAWVNNTVSYTSSN